MLLLLLIASCIATGGFLSRLCCNSRRARTLVQHPRFVSLKSSFSEPDSSPSSSAPSLRCCSRRPQHWYNIRFDEEYPDDLPDLELITPLPTILEDEGKIHLHSNAEDQAYTPSNKCFLLSLEMIKNDSSINFIRFRHEK